MNASRDSNAIDPRSRNRSRVVLLLIAAIFVAPFAMALVLYYSAWQPTHTKNYGELVKPPRDLRDLHLYRTDGQTFAWHHEDHIWRVLVVPPADCMLDCARLVDALRRVWVGLGKDADRVQVLWVGAPPQGANFAALLPLRASPALQARLPDSLKNDQSSSAAIPAYIVDPSGYLVLRYPAGFDPTKLRKDLAQLLK